jgi:proteic killer suppression protein
LRAGEAGGGDAKGLNRLVEDDDSSGVKPEHFGKLRNILARLFSARVVVDMDLPGFRLHALKGEMRRFGP